MCFCRRPTPCVCDKNQGVNYHKIWDEIKDWMSNIPVYPNINEEDKIKQGQMLNELIDTFRKILQEPSFHFKAKREILKFLNELPMWHPYDSKEDNLFIDHIADILIDKMENAAEAILKEEIAKEIEKLPLDSTDINRDDIHEVTDQFINRLKQIIADRHYGKEGYKEAIKSEITDLLDNLPLRYESQKIEVKSEIADQFSDRIQKIKLPIRKQTTTKLQETGLNSIKNRVIDICKDILELTDVKTVDKKELFQFLKDKVSEYIPRDLEDIEVQQKVQNEIKDWIENSTIGKHLGTKTKNKFGERIKQELQTDTINNDDEATVNIVSKWIEDNIENKIIDICKDIPELSNLKPSEKIELSEFLKYKINEYFPKDLADSEVQQKVHKEIKEWLESSKISQRVDIKNKDKLAERIMQKLRTDFIKKEDEDIIDILNKWIPGIAELIQVNQLDKKEVLEDLAIQLYEIQTSGEDIEYILVEVKETIRDWLDNMLRKFKMKVNLVIQENLVNELVKKINKAPKHKMYKQSEGPNNMYNDVVEWIKDIPSIDSNTYDDINQNNAIEDLMNTLNDVINNFDEELVEEQAKNAINTFVEKLADTKRLEINPKQQNILEQILLRKIKQAPPRRKRLHKQYGFGSSTPKSYISGGLSQSAQLSTNLTPHFSPIRNVSILDVHAEIDEYMNTINNLIGNWIEKLELSIESAEQRKLVSDVVTDIVDRHKYLQISKKPSSEAEELEHLKFQIFRRLNKLNLEELPRIISKVNDLHKNLAPIKTPELTKSLNKSDLKSNLNNLKTSIKTWFDNIPPDTAELYKKSYSDTVFMDLAKRLAEHKDSINHYQMKNDILQWLPKLFVNLSTNTLNNLADSLKSHLVNDLAQSMAHDVTAGLIYRQMLWDTISKTLPPIHIASSDDLHHFDLLKERLIDAFINLHYFTNNMVALDKFKTKLFNVVDKFCNEYLNRYPEPPIDSEEITKNLYNALRQVSVPNIETVKSELEQVRLKEDILDWIPNLPLDASKDMEPEINAMAAGLAKRVHSLEKERHNDPDKEDEIKQEITKLVQKLPLKNIELVNLQDFVAHLLEKLKSTDKSRTLNVSNMGKYDESIAPITSTSLFPESNDNKATSIRGTSQSPDSDADKRTPFKRTLQYPDSKDEKSTSIPKTSLYFEKSDDKVTLSPRTSLYPESNRAKVTSIPRSMPYPDNNVASIQMTPQRPDIADDKVPSNRRISQHPDICKVKDTSIQNILHYPDVNDDKQPSIRRTSQHPDISDKKETSIPRTLQHPDVDDDKVSSTIKNPDISEDKGTSIRRTLQRLDIGDDLQPLIRRTSSGRTMQHIDIGDDKQSSIWRTFRYSDISDAEGTAIPRTLQRPDIGDDLQPMIRRTPQYSNISEDKGIYNGRTMQPLDIGVDKQHSVRRTSQYPKISDDKETSMPRTLQHPDIVDKKQSSARRTSQHPAISTEKEISTRRTQHPDIDDDMLPAIKRTSQYPGMSDDKISPIRRINRYPESVSKKLTPIPRTSPLASSDERTAIERALEYPECSEDKLISIRTISQYEESSDDKITSVPHYPEMIANKSTSTQSKAYRSKKYQRTHSEMKIDDDNLPSNRRISQYPEISDEITPVQKKGTIDETATSYPRASQYLESSNDKITPVRRNSQFLPSSLNAEDRAHLDRIRRRVERDQENKYRYRDATVSPPQIESGIQTEINSRLEDNTQTRPLTYERGHLSPQVIIKEYYWDSPINTSKGDIAGDIRSPCSPCPRCNKISQITSQVLTVNKRTVATQTENQDETYTQTKEDKICDRRVCIKGTLENRTSRPPPCYFPERKIYQKNLPSEALEQRSKDNKCCNCGQRIYTKCRGRYRGIKQHCNLTCLKSCFNCGSGCPYPSKFYFRREL